jgi:undecaprenyl diphosphate synthase
MDGNGRWAKGRNLPRIMGHKAGGDTAKKIITACAKREITALTLFAFSTENWQRPEKEVQFLMETFFSTLNKELPTLHKNNIKFRVIGERTTLSKKLQVAITKAEKLTANNTGMNLSLAINYSGRWDILQAAKTLLQEVSNNTPQFADFNENVFAHHLALADLPEPDLFIRTSGEIRISNFMLWQLAYTELYFTDIYWPDFDEQELEKALQSFATRQRRFGKITP